MSDATNTVPTASLPRTLGDLRALGYTPRTVKQELRANALCALERGETLFPGVMGYAETVVPQLVQAILSEHDILLLGLRGQAKTRLLRQMTSLLDEWVPVIDADGVDLNDDPLAPTTRAGRLAVDTHGDATPLRWLHRSQRFHEKLATPDVTIADLVGEIDLIKHAEGRHLSDEATMHFGLVPRSNRGLFVLNELPDLAPRIQVGLFNVLEERDVQIRGYPVRLDLDLCLMFSANPEDYTNRGRIVTPLKDRIGSVVRTHYPANNREAMEITRANAFVERTPAGSAGAKPHADAQSGAKSPDKDPAAYLDASPDAWSPAAAPSPPSVVGPDVVHEIIEEAIRLARTSPHVNQASGVSVRASIACLECVVSAAEMRALRTKEQTVVARPCDFAHLAAALRGKIELMLADDSADGATAEDRLIHAFIGEAVKSVLGRAVAISEVEHLTAEFESGLRLELDDRTSAQDAVASIGHVDGLLDAARAIAPNVGLDPSQGAHLACAAELVLEFLYVNNRLSKVTGPGGGYTR